MAKLGAVSNIVTAAEVDPWAEVEKFEAISEPKIQQIGIIGPPGSGKTTAALSISDIFSGDIPAKKHTVLSDTFFISADKGGFDTVRAYGYSAPGVDLSNIDPAVTDVSTELRKALDTAIYGTQHKGIKNIVVDTVSAIDNMLLVYAQRNFDKYAMWNFILSAHTSLMHKLASTDATVVLIFHGKVIAGDQLNQEGKDKLATRKKATMAEAVDTEIEVSGQARGFYRKHLSLLLTCMRDPLIKQPTYKFYPRGKGSMEGKSRFWMLDAEEPANLKLLINKIRDNLPK
jgi:hypothetical protein